MRAPSASVGRNKALAGVERQLRRIRAANRAEEERIRAEAEEAAAAAAAAEAE